METLLSVPPALAAQFHTLFEHSNEGIFVAHDPVDKKLGSGGGTAHLAVEAWKHAATGESFEAWIEDSKRLIVHAGGQSRRLPAYAPSGKAIVPIPVFRWMSGQRINQTLLDLQSPLLRGLLEKSSDRQKWLIASGDVLVWHNRSLPEIPDVDVLCVGIPESPETASGHGVFFTSQQDPTQLQYMLQKPSTSDIASRSAQSLFFIDVGIWILSTRALLALMGKSGWQPENQSFTNGAPDYYDLYSEFGLALGQASTQADTTLAHLSSAVLPLPQAEFYHFGRNSDIIRSSLALQNRVHDPQRILSPMVKPHPSIFIQNSCWETRLTENNHDVWIENSYIGKGWELDQQHVLTGIPNNDWKIQLPRGVCVDIIPREEGSWILRPYGYDDPFTGSLNASDTRWMGIPISEWCKLRDLNVDDLVNNSEVDIQSASLFPVVDSLESAEELLGWMIGADGSSESSMRDLYLSAHRLSAEDISKQANLLR